LKSPKCFWLPAASGGAAVEANITVVLLMPFTQNLPCHTLAFWLLALSLHGIAKH